jgi:hypothetical protein
MAFQASTLTPRHVTVDTTISDASTPHVSIRPAIEQSQEWILFSPSQGESSTDHTLTSQTVGLSRASDFGSLNTAARSTRLESDQVDETAEDAELDILDDGLNAFQEPIFPIPSQPSQGPQLPTHDGLGMFPASSPPVLEQLWQHEQYNPKRKHDGHHRRTSSIQRRLNTINELEAQANDEKRMRIERWRLEQSQAMIDEVERETRRRARRQPTRQETSTMAEDIFGTTPKQSDYISTVTEETEPFWRRLTRRFIRDIIGIDEPLLSVILGESLPEEDTEVAKSAQPLPATPDHKPEPGIDGTWRDRLLQRIARELGVFVHQLSPHPGPFTRYSSQHHDYAGMPVSIPRRQSYIRSQSVQEIVQVSTLTPNFPPTIQDRTHAETWGFEEESSVPVTDSSLNLRQEREYWERELDVKMVFRFLRDRITSRTDSTPAGDSQRLAEDNAKRTAIIRQHHPLVARTSYRSPARQRRESRLSQRRPHSSCASESAKSSLKSLIRSGSSRNYWDIGGSIGSGSMLASGGAWGEA